jgi:hypothetical protein
MFCRRCIADTPGCAPFPCSARDNGGLTRAAPVIQESPLTIIIDLSERQSIRLGVGYDPADSEWHLIDTLMKSDLTETTQTELTTTLERWLENRYAAEDISPPEEGHDVLSS